MSDGYSTTRPARRAMITTLKRNASCTRGLLLGSLALLFASSCQNDKKNLVGPTPRGKAHVPVSFATATTDGGATLTTDKDDYAPGETLILTGANWPPGDVAIHLDETPRNHDPLDWTVVADETGAFTDATYEVQDSDLGVTFTITATSQVNPSETATATFRDAAAVLTISSISPSSPAPGDAITAALSVDFQACSSGCPNWRATKFLINATATVDASALASAVCVDQNPDVLGGTTNRTENRNVVTSLTAPSSGSYYLHARLFTDDACTNSTGGVKDFGPFTVTSAGPTKLAFTTDPRTGVVGQCLGPITVQTQNASGVATNVTSNTTVNLATDGAGGFYSDNACATSITGFTITNGNNSGSFYYKATAQGDGTHELTASAADLTSDKQTQLIGEGATSTAIGAATSTSAAATSSVYGQVVTFTATVTVNSPGSGTPTGSVTFKQGGTACLSASALPGAGNPATLDGTGKASFQISTLDASATAYTIRACYGGSTTFASSANSNSFTVNPAATSTAIGAATSTSAAATSSVYGQLVTFTATVTVNSPGSGTPIGNVTFKVGGTSCTDATQPVGATANPATLNASGGASFQMSTLDASATAYTIRACYGGSTNFATSANSNSFTVNKAQITSTASVSPSPQQYSDKVTLSASINIQSPGALAQTVTGSVDFYIGTTLVGTQSSLSITSVPSTVTLSPAYALVQAAGSYTLTARFTSTNSNFNGTSTSTGETTAGLTVTKENATIDYLSSNAGAIPVSQTSFTLTVNLKETYPELNSDLSLAALGDITNAGLIASLSGVSTPTNYNGSCLSTGVSGTGYSKYNSFTCTFSTSSSFTVDAYAVSFTVMGNYYAGSYDDVLIVFDPTAGFVTGGGKFQLGSNDRVSFGLSYTYTKGKTTPRGGLVVIRHYGDGRSCRVKSNSLDGAAVIGTTARARGQGNYTCLNASGQTTDSKGNLSLALYVEDNATPGAGFDKFWIAAYGELSMGGDLSTAPAYAAVLTGGNIQVPQPGSR